jgi:uncharacterized BrkB/YihY/UPF0761 family membrane protein
LLGCSVPDTGFRIRDRGFESSYGSSGSWGSRNPKHTIVVARIGMYWYLALGIVIGFLLGLLVTTKVSVTYASATVPDEDESTE